MDMRMKCGVLYSGTHTQSREELHV
uniref:Uncharacterized protein n=1 Tax=Anguilla anguilla TaxID=7936 RepID=A0A0E9S3Y0_ANGAN